MAEETFVKLVRAGKIKQPTQKSFTVDKWRDAFNSINQPSDEDAKLYSSGLWFHDRLETIRDILKHAPKTNIPSSQIIQAYINAVNSISINMRSTSVDIIDIIGKLLC